MGLDTTIRVVVDVLLFLDARRNASRERREDPEYMAEDVSALPLSGLLSRNPSQATSPPTSNLSRAGSYQDDLDLHLASLSQVPLKDTGDESSVAASESRSRASSHVKNLLEQQRRHSKKGRGVEENEKGNGDEDDQQNLRKSRSRIKQLSFLGLGKRRGNNKENKDKKHESLVKSAAEQEEEDLLDFAKTFFTWAESRLEEQGADEGLRRDVHVAGRSLVEEDWDALRKVFEPALNESHGASERRQSTTTTDTPSTGLTSRSSFNSAFGSEQGSNANRRHRRPRTVSKSAHLVPIPPLRTESEVREATTASTVSTLQKLILRIEDTLVDDLTESTVNVAKRVDRSAILVQKRLHKEVLRRRSQSRRKRAAMKAAEAENERAGRENSDSNIESDATYDTDDVDAGIKSSAVLQKDTDDGEAKESGGVFHELAKSLSYLQRLSLGRMASLSVTEDSTKTEQPVPLEESEDMKEEENNVDVDLLEQEPIERSGTMLRSVLSDVEESVGRKESSEVGSRRGKRGKRRHLLPKHRPHLFHKHRHENRKAPDVGDGDNALAPRRRRKRKSDPDTDKALIRASKVGTRQQERLEALRQILSQQRRSVNGAVIPHHMRHETDELLTNAPELLVMGGKKESLKLKRFSPRFLRKQVANRDNMLMSLESDGPAANVKNSTGLYDSESSDVGDSTSDDEGGNGYGPEEVAGLLDSFEHEGQQHTDTGVMDRWKGYMDLLRSASWFPTTAEKAVFFKNAAVAPPVEEEGNVGENTREEEGREV